MVDLNRELNEQSTKDFENTAAKDTSTTSTRNFDSKQEEAAITAAAKAAAKNSRGKS